MILDSSQVSSGLYILQNKGKMETLSKLKDLFVLLKHLNDLNELKKKINRKKRRSCWVRKINLNRETHGYFRVTFLKIKEVDPQQFFIHTRMNIAAFSDLLNLTRPFLTKTSIRKAIDPECQLALTLLYLSQGTTIQSLAWSFKLGKETARKLILDCCEVLWKVLSPAYVSEPNLNDFVQIRNDFWTLWNLPNCIGSIDGKHIALKCPPNSGSQFYNYKQFFSIVLLAVSDAKYAFTYVDVGAYGSQSDGGVFQNSSFGKRLLRKEIPLPSPAALPGTNEVIENYFVGDAAFPLGENLMRPYPGRQLTKEKEVFNKRLSRARRVIENAFGILVTRWRILFTTIYMIPTNAEKVVLACIALHNFLQLNKDSARTYCSEYYVDWEDEYGVVHPGLWRNEVEGNINSIRPSRTQHRYGGQRATEMRNQICNFLNSNPLPDTNI